MQAHWVRRGHAQTNHDFTVALVAGAFLALAQAWNFWEHAHGRPSPPT